MKRERGVAVVTALLLTTLAITIVASLFWQQQVQVRSIENQRLQLQKQWVLRGALDWARLILREDAVTGGADHLGEPWAVPLAEAKLSTFLAVDRENTDDAPEAFLSGSIVDAQARYNLRNLIEPQAQQAAAELRSFQRLLDAIGVRPDLAPLLAQALRDAAPQALAAAGSSAGEAATVPRAADPPLMPERLSQLDWLGVDATTIAKLAPYVVLLPVRTPRAGGLTGTLASHQVRVHEECMLPGAAVGGLH
mgnify:CR=1 FL=1